MEKRTWVYIQQPKIYGISCDRCGGLYLEWSEFEGCAWCPTCQIDSPGTSGIFEGPIPFDVCVLLGISFDRIDLKTGKRMIMAIKDGKMNWY